MDPAKQECHGDYLYGSGYMATEDERVGDVVGGFRSFCKHVCSRAATCEETNRLRAGVESPQSVEIYDRMVREYESFGIKEATVALVRAKTGNPDPYYRRAMDNFRRGTLDRRAIDKEAGRVG